METHVPISLDFFTLYNTANGEGENLHFLSFLVMHLKFTLNITPKSKCQK
jgi:hypothetical protein